MLISRLSSLFCLFGSTSPVGMNANIQVNQPSPVLVPYSSQKNYQMYPHPCIVKIFHHSQKLGKIYIYIRNLCLCKIVNPLNLNKSEEGIPLIFFSLETSISSYFLHSFLEIYFYPHPLFPLQIIINCCLFIGEVGLVKIKNSNDMGWGQ